MRRELALSPSRRQAGEVWRQWMLLLILLLLWANQTKISEQASVSMVLLWASHTRPPARPLAGRIANQITYNKNSTNDVNNSCNFKYTRLVYCYSPRDLIFLYGPSWMWSYAWIIYRTQLIRDCLHFLGWPDTFVIALSDSMSIQGTANFKRMRGHLTCPTHPPTHAAA